MASCCIDVCRNNYHNNKAVSYYRFPMYQKNQDLHDKCLLLQQRMTWINSLKDVSSIQISNIYKKRVCSEHFITGKKAHHSDVNNPDWVPNRKLTVDEISDESKVDVDVTMVYESYDDPVPIDTIPNPKQPEKDEIEFDLNFLQQETAYVAKVVAEINVNFDHLDVQCEDVLTIQNLLSIIRAQNQIIECLRQELLVYKMDMDSFKGNDKKTAYYTGLPNFDILEVIYEKLEPFIMVKAQSILSKSQVLIMTLMKLRLGLSFVDLGYRFGVSTSTACRQFYSCLDVMYYKLKSLVFVPDRDEVIRTMPNQFLKNFGKKVTHIVDCTEFLTEKPHFLDTAAEMWSEYKHHYTVKMFISITPQCFIEFISRLYGGRATDIYITTDCGFLEILVPEDFILADKGFKMNDQFEMHQAHLELPAFVYQKEQLHPLEVERTRKIANVRIHVERVIGFVKRKFLLLHQIIPMSMLSRPVSESEDVCLLDKIMTVCCALCNLCPPVV